uniref:C2H2-type domain-containing protein n=1 Tax=Kalanchoe fedtschenkoi TaxID=63787 RepID=A0A7N0T8M6_KALFE
MKAAYGLRQNPKKSLRFSGSGSGSVPDQKMSCKICGKAFLTNRQLCGHMRHHTPGERQGIRCHQCAKNFGSIRALCGHMKSHRALDCTAFLTANGIRKRSRTPRFEVPGTHFDDSAVEDVAISLILLSEGLEFRVSENPGKVELVDSLKSNGSNDPLADLGTEDAKSLNAELDESVTVEPLSTEVRCDDAMPSVSCSKAKYSCQNCNRDFSSHQALGGHRSSRHKSRRCPSALKTETFHADHTPVAEPTPHDVQMDGLCLVGVTNFELLKRCNSVDVVPGASRCYGLLRL